MVWKKLIGRQTEGDQPEVETVDQAKMQEMMNPQTMQTYLGQVSGTVGLQDTCADRINRSPK